MTRRLPFLLALLLLAGLPACHKAPPPSSKQTREEKKLQRELSSFHRELREARRRLERKAHLEQEILPDLPADPNEALPVLKRELFELVRAIDGLDRHIVLQPPAFHHTEKVGSLSGSFSFDVPSEPRNLQVTLRNVGTKLIVNPRLQANGVADWYDEDAIVQTVVQPGMTDREKALALWKFVIAARVHGNPAHPGLELDDPVRMLNVYGYGFCDDAATVLAILARHAGLQSRLWGLEGHVVPEIFFGGQWHMLDPDGEIYYFDQDGKTIAGVETLENHPELIRRRVSPIYPNTEDLVKIYGPADNRLMDLDHRMLHLGHRMNFTLRPGESLLRSADGWGKYFSSAFYNQPRRNGNGLLTFQPVLSGDLYKLGALAAQGFTALHSATGEWQLETSAPAATLVYRFELPYAMLDGELRADLTVPPNASLRVEASADGQTWTRLFITKSSGSQHLVLPLSTFIPNGFGDPLYAYDLRLRAETKGEPVRVANLAIDTEFQVAPKSLPQLVPGANTITFQTEGEPGSALEIDFGYDLK